MAKLKAVCPISDEDVDALPVKDLSAAIRFYESVLGFSVRERDTSSAVLKRDEVKVGLTCKALHEPGKAGSIAFAVDEIEEMHEELRASGGEPGEFGIDDWDGRRHRTFFVREKENGYCYCFYSPLSSDSS